MDIVYYIYSTYVVLIYIDINIILDINIWLILIIQ